MQYARSAAAVLEVVTEPRGSTLRRAGRFISAPLGSTVLATNVSMQDVVVRRKDDGTELLRRAVLHTGEFIVDEMRHDLPKRDVDAFLAKWSESEFYQREL